MIPQSSSQFEILYAFHSLGRETHFRKEKALRLACGNRVIQTGLNTFMVESKRYLRTLGKPSKFYIVIQNRAKPWIFNCCCKHSGVHPSPYNCCSHILAVILTICLYSRSTRLLLMREAAMNENLGIGAQILKQKARIENALCYDCKRQVTLNRSEFGYTLNYQCNQCGHFYFEDKFNKLIEFNKEWQGVPLTGNEYWEHVKTKKKIHDILVEDQWAEVEYERKVHCRNPHTKLLNKFPYHLDVYAGRHIENRYVMIGVEINGEYSGGGHGSKITIHKDRNRAEDIWEQYHIKVIQFNLDHIKDCDGLTILKEIYQNIGNPT